MAIKNATVFKTIVLPEAYVRVVEVRPSAIRNKTDVIYQVWASEAHRNTAKATPLETKEVEFAFEAATGDIFSWAYAKLKSLPEFATAVDVLEPAQTPEELEEVRLAEMRRLKLYNEDGAIPGGDAEA